jgi:hypothetical protein
MALLLLLGASGRAGAQDTAAVRLEVELRGSQHNARVLTRNLLEDTPWLSALRQGLPVRLVYRLEIWRSREAWLDDVVRQVEWTVLVRHEPLLDQFSVVILRPNNSQVRGSFGTPGALAAFLSLPFDLPIAPSDPGRYYYGASLAVATLSDSDLDKFEAALRGDLDPRSAEGGSLVERARRFILRLAGLPTLSLTATSEPFEIK